MGTHIIAEGCKAQQKEVITAHSSLFINTSKATIDGYTKTWDRNHRQVVKHLSKWVQTETIWQIPSSLDCNSILDKIYILVGKEEMKNSEALDILECTKLYMGPVWVSCTGGAFHLKVLFSFLLRMVTKTLQGISDANIYCSTFTRLLLFWPD